MVWRIVFSVVIPEILDSRSPVDEELVLFYSVLDPIKSHINCFGAFLFDCAIGKIYCSGGVNLHGVGVGGCPISSRAVRIGIAS